MTLAFLGTGLGYCNATHGLGDAKKSFEEFVSQSKSLIRMLATEK